MMLTPQAAGQDSPLFCLAGLHPEPDDDGTDQLDLFLERYSAREKLRKLRRFMIKPLRLAA